MSDLTPAMRKALEKWSDGRASHFRPKGVRYDTFKRLWIAGYLANAGFLVSMITDKGREALGGKPLRQATEDETTIFICMIKAPHDFKELLQATGLQWAKWEAQPIADQIKLTGCSSIPEDLPPWCERLSDRNIRHTREALERKQ